MGQLVLKKVSDAEYNYSSSKFGQLEGSGCEDMEGSEWCT